MDDDTVTGAAVMLFAICTGIVGFALGYWMAS